MKEPCILNIFNHNGLRFVIGRHLGRRGKTKAAFTYVEAFTSMSGSHLCGGDCIEDVMEIKPFWDYHSNLIAIWAQASASARE